MSNDESKSQDNSKNYSMTSDFYLIAETFKDVITKYSKYGLQDKFPSEILAVLNMTSDLSIIDGISSLKKLFKAITGILKKASDESFFYSFMINYIYNYDEDVFNDFKKLIDSKKLDVEQFITTNKNSKIEVLLFIAYYLGVNYFYTSTTEYHERRAFFGRHIKKIDIQEIMLTAESDIAKIIEEENDELNEKDSTKIKENKTNLDRKDESEHELEQDYDDNNKIFKTVNEILKFTILKKKPGDNSTRLTAMNTVILFKILRDLNIITDNTSILTPKNFRLCLSCLTNFTDRSIREIIDSKFELKNRNKESHVIIDVENIHQIQDAVNEIIDELKSLEKSL